MAAELQRSLSGGRQDTHKLLVAAAATLKTRLLTVARVLSTKAASDAGALPLLAAQPAVDSAAAAAGAYQKLLSALSDFVLRLPGDTARHLLDINLPAATEQLLAAITPELLLPAQSSAAAAAPQPAQAAVQSPTADTGDAAQQGEQQQQQQQQQQQVAAWEALQALMVSVFECLKQQAEAAIVTLKRTPDALPVLEQLAGAQLMGAAALHCRHLWQLHTAALPSSTPAVALHTANSAADSSPQEPGAAAPAAAAVPAAATGGIEPAGLSQHFIAPVVAFGCLYGYLLTATESLQAAEPVRQQLLEAVASTGFLAAACQLLLGADAEAARSKVTAYQLSAWQLLALACALAGGNLRRGASGAGAWDGGTAAADAMSSGGGLDGECGQRSSGGGGISTGMDGSAGGASSAPSSPAAQLPWQRQQQQQQQPWMAPLPLAASQALAAPEVLSFLQERFCHALRELRAGCVPLPAVRLLPGRAAPEGQDVLMALWRVLCCWRSWLRCPDAGPFAASVAPDPSTAAATAAAPTTTLVARGHFFVDEAASVSAPGVAGLLAAALDSALAESVSSGSAREALRAETAFAAVDCLQELCLMLDTASVRQNLSQLSRSLCGVLSATAAHWEASKAAMKCANLPFSAQVKMAGRGTGELLRRWSRAAGACVSTLHLLLDVAGGRGGSTGGGGSGGGAVSLLSLAGLRVGGEGQAELSSAAAVMMEAGLLAALEQLFRQTPPASTAHAGAAELLACMAPLAAAQRAAANTIKPAAANTIKPAASPAARSITAAPSANSNGNSSSSAHTVDAKASAAQSPVVDTAALLSPFVTLRKFLHRCCGLPEPDREQGVQVAAALCDLVGRLASEEACDEQYAAFVVAQLLPGLQALCTSLLKTPGAALVPDAHGGMQHLFPKLLHMLSQLAAADAGKGPCRQQRFLPLLLAHQSAHVVQGILASAYYALPQLSPVPLLSGSLTGDYAAAVAIGLLEDLCASLGPSDGCSLGAAAAAAGTEQQHEQQLLLTTSLVRSGLMGELQRTLQLLLQPAPLIVDGTGGAGLPGLRVGSGSLSRSASGSLPMGFMGSRGSSPRASSPRISGYAGGAGLGASLGDLRGIGQLAALIKGGSDAAAAGGGGGSVSSSRSIARSGSGVSLAVAASVHSSRFGSSAGNGVSGMSAPSAAGLLGSSYGSSASGLLGSGLGSGSFAGALGAGGPSGGVAAALGSGACGSGTVSSGHGSGALFGSTASLASLAGSQTLEELLNQPSGAAVRCLQARLDAVVLAVADTVLRQLSVHGAPGAKSLIGAAGAARLAANPAATPAATPVAVGGLTGADGEGVNALQAALAAARAGQAAAAAALQPKEDTSASLGSHGMSGGRVGMMDGTGGLSLIGAPVLVPAALLRRVLSALTATGQLLGRYSAASEISHSADVLMARSPLKLGCWNVKCMQMGGPSEAKVVLKPCAGCGVAAFCGKRECEKAAGGAHARACSHIAAMRAGQ